MNIVFIKILICEVLVAGVILTPIILLNLKIKKLTRIVKANNRGLRELIMTVRSILKLSGEYVEILQNALKEKMYSLVVLLGEMTSYSIMRRMFSKSYKNYVIGFNIARWFW